MKRHPSITPERIRAACEARQTTLDDPGFCKACGQDAYGVEPDARNYVCEACGSHQVFGCEELLMELPL